MDTPQTLPPDLLLQLSNSLCDDICCGIFVVETLRDDSGNPQNFIGRIANKPFCELLSLNEKTLLGKELPKSLVTEFPLRDMLLEASAAESRKFFKAHLPDCDSPCNILVYSPLPGFQAVIIKGTHAKSGNVRLTNMLYESDGIPDQAEEVLAGLGELCTVIDKNFVIQYQNSLARKFWGNCQGRTCRDAYQCRTDKCDDCHAAKAFSDGEIHKGEKTRRTAEGETHLEITATPLRDAGGAIKSVVLLGRDMSSHKIEEKSKEHLIKELQACLSNTKRLTGLLTICSYCKKIKDTNGTWQQLESYLRSHAEVEFSHGICHECGPKYHPQVFPKKK